HLPHHPLDDARPPAHIRREKAPGLLREIDQDRAGLEHRERLAAVGRPMVDDGRDPVVRADRQELRAKLFAGADVDGDDPVGEPQLLQHDRDFPAVRRRRVMEVDHAVPAQMVAVRLKDSSDSEKPPRVMAGLDEHMYPTPKTWQTGAQIEPDREALDAVSNHHRWLAAQAGMAG